MRKKKTRKRVQRFAFLCSMFIMAFLFAFTSAKEVKASQLPTETKLEKHCSLQSVTIEAGGKEYICDGSLEYIPVSQDVEWKDFLKNVKITDYKVLVDKCCSHAEGHDSITACLSWYDNGYVQPNFCIYEDDGNEGKNTNPDVDETLDQPSYNVLFCLDGDIRNSVSVAFSREYPISYELNGGFFPAGIDAPDTGLMCETSKLIAPVKSGSQFLGWTLEGDETGEYRKTFWWDGVDSPPTFVAHWDDTKAPIDIGTYKIGVGQEVKICEGGVTTVVTVSNNSISLTEGKDYYLSYKNNDKIASKNSENPPTVTITGIGKYTGTVDKTFSIVENDLIFRQDYVNSRCSLRIAKGKPLSSIDLSSIHVIDSYFHEVKGTFSWTNEEYVPEGEVGDCLSNDPDSEEKTYELIFTPDNQEIYSTVSCSSIEIHVYQGDIADCQVTFASGKQSYLYTGEEIKPEVIVKDGETTLVEGTDYELYYAGYLNKASSTDKYAPTVTIEGKNLYIGTKKVTYTISMAPEPPVLTAVNETIRGKKDGSITGLTTDMEYRMALPSVGENTAPFTPVTDAAMTFPTGNYEVRYTAKGIYDPSPVTTVVIQQGKALVVTLPKEQTGYTLTATANELSWQGTTTLTLTLASGYIKTKDFALEANVNLVDNQDGTYTISGVTEDVTVTVRGIAIDTTPTATPTASPTATPTTKPTESPTATPDVGTKLKAKDKKASYIVSKVKNNTVEVQYKAPVKKAKKVTIAKTVTLSDGTVAKVTSIANNAFKDNKKLQEITIGNSITTIGKNTFSGCINLKKVVIGTGVTTIGSNAFKNCKKLKTIIIKSKKLKTLSKTALKGIPSKATIKVPSSKYKEYKKLLRKKGLKKSVNLQKAS